MIYTALRSLEEGQDKSVFVPVKHIEFMFNVMYHWYNLRVVFKMHCVHGYTHHPFHLIE